MDGIGQQGHAAAAQGHGKLEKRRNEQHHQRDLDSKDAGPGRQSRIAQRSDGGMRMALPMLPGGLVRMNVRLFPFMLILRMIMLRVTMVMRVQMIAHMLEFLEECCLRKIHHR